MAISEKDYYAMYGFEYDLHKMLQNYTNKVLEDIKAEIKYSEINGLWKPNYKEGFNDGIAKAVEIIVPFFISSSFLMA